MNTTPTLIVTTLALAMVLYDPSVAARDLKLKAAPVALPAKARLKTVKTPPLKSTPLNTGSQGLGGVARGGMAGQQLKQVKQLQQLHQATQPGAALGQGPGASSQDCGPGNLNPAGCLGGTTQTKPGPQRQSMQDCLAAGQAGGDPTDCTTRNHGKTGPADQIRANMTGPGSPTDGMNIPGRGQAQQDGEDSHGRFKGWDTSTGTRHANGDTTTTRMGDNEDGTRVREDTTHDRHGREVSWSRTVRDRNGAIIDHKESATSYDDDGRPLTLVHDNEGTDREQIWSTSYPPHFSNQPAPEGSSDGTTDGCDWVPLQGCREKRADPLGMTSQPGPGQQEGGTRVGGFAGTSAGASAVTNCGDASSDACNRGGAGLSSGGQPLDMKDTGTAFGGVPGVAPHQH